MTLLPLPPSVTAIFFIIYGCFYPMPWLHALALKSPSASTTTSPKIAVIGSGAAGLAAARVLQRNGLEPTVLEQEPNSGGVWKYHPGSRTRPVYRGLRTNLPKEIMSYREHPWQPLSNNPQEDPSFVAHAQVLQYLQSYQQHFRLDKFIHFGCAVDRLRVLEGSASSVSPPNESWPQIQIKWTQQQDLSDTSSSTPMQRSETFDAVLVCNGHYAKPSIPKLRGAEEYFTGRTLHSIEYDNPQEFEGQNVLCIGARASGEDLAREISMHASKVVLSSSTCPPGQAPETQGKVTLVPRTKEVQSDGSFLFDGYSETLKFDTVIWCTGYDYDFPFIDDGDRLVQCIPGERRVKPLFEQLFHAQYPNLSFLGLPHSVLPFPLFEFQAEAVVAQFTSSTKGYNLPDLNKRMEFAEEDAVSGGPNDGGRIQDTHFLGNYQWGYVRRLARLAGTKDDEIDSYLETTVKIWDFASAKRKGSFPGGPDSYRGILYERDDENRAFAIRNDVYAAK